MNNEPTKPTSTIIVRTIHLLVVIPALVATILMGLLIFVRALVYNSPYEGFLFMLYSQYIYIYLGFMVMFLLMVVGSMLVMAKLKKIDEKFCKNNCPVRASIEENSLLKDQKLNARTKRMLDSAPIMIEYWDEDFNAIDCNKLTLEFFGIDSKEHYTDVHLKCISRRKVNGTTSWDSWKYHLEEIFEKGISKFEFAQYDIKGELVFMEVYGVCIEEEDRKIAVTYAKDITQQKRDEQIIAKSQEKVAVALDQALFASQAKSNFLSNMSHEIRTPLNAITGMVNLAIESNSLDIKNDRLGKIKSASNHLLGVINSILDMSKIEADKLELHAQSFDFHKMINDVSSVLSIKLEEKNIKYVVDIDENLPHFIIADDLRLAQVILNLLSNAVKFTLNNGTVSLKAICESNEKGNSILRIEVIDTGIGISEDKFSRLFGAFEQAGADTTREFGGTGLGLAISKRVIEMMEGDIWVESEVGKGSKFIFTVPYQSDDMAKSENTKDESQVQKNTIFEGFTILLAEDVEINREIVVAMLEPTLVNIDCAENGLEALKMFKANPNRYDMIFMDLQMPQMDGITAAMLIRDIETDKAKNIPIVAMTANVFQEDVDRCLEAGMNGHLPKPLDFDLMLKLLGQYLNRD